MSAPRVLVSGLVLGQPMGGVRRHNLELLPRLAARLNAGGGRLAVLEPRGGLPKEVRAGLVGVELLAGDAPGSPAWRRAFTETRALRAALERHGPFDRVHTGHLPVPGDLGVPLTWTLHDLRRASKALGRRAIADGLRRAERVLTVSEAVASDLRARFGAERVTWVGNGADHLPRTPRATGADVDVDAPRGTDPISRARGRVLVVGHLEPRKDPFTAVRALAHDHELPELLFVGAWRGATLARLCREAQRLGVASRVRFAGPVSDEELAGAYAVARAVLCPSRLEGFDIPLAEALHAGCPVAVSDLPAHRELAPEAPRFAPGDAAACARALRAALAGPAPTATPSTWDACADRCWRAWTARD